MTKRLKRMHEKLDPTFFYEKLRFFFKRLWIDLPQDYCLKVFLSYQRKDLRLLE